MAGELSQSGWTTPSAADQMAAQTGGLGQSAWVTAGDSTQHQGSAALGQSAWTNNPGSAAANKLEQASWVKQNRAMAAAAKARASAGRAGEAGQSGWMAPAPPAPSDLACGATLSPARVSESLDPVLEGAVSQTDIVDDSLAFHGAPGGMAGSMAGGVDAGGLGVGAQPRMAAPSAGMQAGAVPVSAAEAGGAPVNSVEQMMGAAMAMPMMMAQSMQMLGGFGGGFRGYGPGAVAPGCGFGYGGSSGVAVRLPGGCAIGVRTPSLNRVVNRALNNSLGGMRVRVRF